MRDPASPPESFWVLLCNLVLVALLGMNIYRAFTQCITIDEAFSYFSFISAPLGDMLKRYDANNHVLNTLLAKATTRFFGASEFSLRIPSLLGGALFLYASQRLILLTISRGWFAFLTYCAVSLNPIVLDYLSAARGYSLALGFQYCALWLLILDQKKRWRDLLIGCCLGLSVASNLTFAIPNALIVCVWFVLNVQNIRYSLHKCLRITGVFAVVGALFLALPLRHAQSSSFYIGNATLSASVSDILSRSFGFPNFGLQYSVSAFLIRVAPAILVASMLVAAGALIARGPQLLIPLTFLLSMAALIALHAFIGLPYPYERTGLYLIPFATITLAVSAQIWSEIVKPRIARPVWAVVVCLFLAAMAFQYVLELKVNRYEEWTFDAGTKRILLKLKEVHQPGSQPDRLGVSWVLDQSVNWYREVYGWDWFQQVSRADPHSNSFDSYYLTINDLNVVRQKGLNVVYTDPVSGAVLALPAR